MSNISKVIKMPALCKNGSAPEETLGEQEKLALAKLHLKRFCFLGTFEPAYIYKRESTVDVKNNFTRLNEYCLQMEPQFMSQILQTAYESVLYRRDEVAVVHAVYLLGDVPVKWKTDLRWCFPTLVKSDTDLFMFCKYAAIIHHDKKQPVFCKTVKKAITAWYKKQTSDEIARMFSTNRGHHGFTHRGLIRMCRITDGILGTKYLYQSFSNSCKTLLSHADEPLPPLPEPKTKPDKNLAEKESKNDIKKAVEAVAALKIDEKKTVVNNDSVEPTTSSSSLQSSIETTQCDQEKIRSIVLGVSTLRTTTGAAEAVKLINELDLKYEHLPYHLLQYPEVLKAVAKSMPCMQLVKCFHSEKIRKHFSKQEVLKVCRERFQRKGGMRGENVDPIMFLMSMDRLSIEQPLKPTNNKNTSRGRLVQFSKQLYRLSFWDTNPTKLRIHITINMQQSYMKKILKNTKSVNYQFAAVALAFSFFKIEENCEVHRWTEIIHKLAPVDWNKKMDFVSAFQTCSYVQNTKNNQRLYVPIIQACEKERVHDLFIVILPAATRGNKKHSSNLLAEYLDRYRELHNEKAKFVIVDLLRYKKSMKYSQTRCENILEICGLDEHTIPLIYNFAMNNFD